MQRARSSSSSKSRRSSSSSSSNRHAAPSPPADPLCEAVSSLVGSVARVAAEGGWGVGSTERHEMPSADRLAAATLLCHSARFVATVLRPPHQRVQPTPGAHEGQVSPRT